MIASLQHHRLRARPILIWLLIWMTIVVVLAVIQVIATGQF